jgi:hypothetical protein
LLEAGSNTHQTVKLMIEALGVPAKNANGGAG